MVNVSVLGLGFVGLTTAVGFAKHRIKTKGFDVIQEKREIIKGGKTPFIEEGLDAALVDVLNSNDLVICDDILSCLADSDVVFLCMGTPMGDDGSADLSYIIKALSDVASCLKQMHKNPVVIIKSTVPPSSSMTVFKPHLESLGITVGKNGDIRLCNNPEFLREGHSYSDFMEPDRVVIGSLNAEEYDDIKEIYQPFNAPIIFTTLNTAEFIKYLSNTTLSTLISYANDMSLLAESVGDINIKQAFNVLSMDKRFSGNPANITSYIYPGLGFGGYCLPKDTFALLKKGEASGYSSPILRGALEVNKNIVTNRAKSIIRDVPKNSKILVLGLSFKPNSDDVRDSRSALLIKHLQASGFKNINAYDPVANEIFQKTYKFENISYLSDLCSSTTDVDCCILATAWDDIKDFYKKSSFKFMYDFRFC